MRKATRPIMVIIVAILQLFFGVLLLAWGLLGAIAMVPGSNSATITITRDGKSTTLVYDTREEMERQAPGYKNVILAGVVADLVLTAAMLAGAVGLLMTWAWGWWLSLAWAVLRLGYHVLTFLYVWYVALPAANRVLQVMPREDGNVAGGLVNSNTLYHAFWLIYSLLINLYPLLILVLLAIPPVWGPLLTKPGRGGEVERPGSRRGGEGDYQPRRDDRDDY